MQRAGGVHVHEAGGDVLVSLSAIRRCRWRVPWPSDVLVDEADADQDLGRGEAPWYGGLRGGPRRSSSSSPSRALPPPPPADDTPLGRAHPGRADRGPVLGRPPERSVGIAPGSEWKRDPRRRPTWPTWPTSACAGCRLGFEWAVIEPRQGVFRWVSVDRDHGGGGRHLPRRCWPWSAPRRSGPAGRAAPRCGARRGTDAAFAAFVTAVAERYGVEGHRGLAGLERAEPRRLGSGPDPRCMAGCWSPRPAPSGALPRRHGAVRRRWRPSPPDNERECSPTASSRRCTTRGHGRRRRGRLPPEQLPGPALRAHRHERVHRPGRRPSAT